MDFYGVKSLLLDGVLPQAFFVCLLMRLLIDMILLKQGYLRIVMFDVDEKTKSQ